MAPRRTFAEVEAVNARLRAVHARLRTLEAQLATSRSQGAQGPILKRLDATYAEREAILRIWAEKVLPLVAGIGAQQAARILGTNVATSRLLAGTIRRIQADAFTDIAGQTSFLKADTKRLLRTIVKETTKLHVARGLSIDEAKRLVATRMDTLGVRAFIDKAGRSWKPDTYARMVVRTRTAISYNVGTVLQAREHGVRRFEVFDGLGDEICASANGEIWTEDETLANPIGHPNCVRAFGPILGTREVA